MNQKQIGIILLIIGILIAASTYMAKIKEDNIIDAVIEEMGGNCFLDDGTCLHEDRDMTFYILAWIFSGALILLGIYLAALDKTDEKILEHQTKVSEALAEAKKQEKSKDEFSAFLAGFNEDEQKLLKIIREEEGIEQSTLRYKADMSKTSVSLTLKSLEERKVIARKPHKTTNKVFLVRKF